MPMFGGNIQTAGTGGGLFGNLTGNQGQPQGGGLFAGVGPSTPQSRPQGGGLFGGLAGTGQPQPQGGLFNTPGQGVATGGLI